MTSKNKISFRILTILLCSLMFFSCSKVSSPKPDNNTETSSQEEKLEMFPGPPDKIVIGHDGKSAEIYREDALYSDIVNGITKRFEQSDVFDYLLLLSFAFNEKTNQNEHLAVYLREEETFIEYIYETPSDQYLTMWGEEPGKKELAPLKPKKIFFPLTGENHDSFCWSESDEYAAPPLATLADNTELISIINSIELE